MKLLSIDIETNGLVWQSAILSIAACYRDGDQVIRRSWSVTAYDLFHSGTPIPTVRGELEYLIKQADRVVGHNLSFDYSFLFKYQVLDPQWVWDKTIDTMILARMTGSYESVSLFNVAGDKGITDPAWTKMKSKRGVLDKVAVETLLHYNETDTYYTLLVAEALLQDAVYCNYTPEQLTRDGNYAIVCAEMRCNGMEVDYQKLGNLVTEYNAKKRFYVNDILLDRRIEGGNDATEIIKFINKHNLPVSAYTEKGKVKTDEESLLSLITDVVHKSNLTPTVLPSAKNDYQFDEQVINALNVEQREVIKVLSAVLNARHYEKALSTWLLPIYEHAKDDGLVHPLYSAGGTVSYRLSCSEPGLQAFPALNIWTPYANADYSQAEYRLMAMYCHSNKLAEGYARGDDAHTNTAKILFGVDTLEKWQRSVGKQFNFATVYGAGMQKLITSTGFPEKRVLEFKEKLKRELPEIGKTTRAVNLAWKERGYIALWTGSRIYASPYDKIHRDYKGFNQLLQGGVAQLIEDVMITMYQKGIKLLGQIHDSLQFPLSEDKEQIKILMESALSEKLSNQTKPAIKMIADYEIKGEC